jgi:hypothetical protein
MQRFSVAKSMSSTGFHDHASGSFSDPLLPAFGPFRYSRNISGNLCDHAKQDEDKEDDVAAKTWAVVDIFDANRKLIRRFASGGIVPHGVWPSGGLR